MELALSQQLFYIIANCVELLIPHNQIGILMDVLVYFNL
jgi:hypothetical protein